MRRHIATTLMSEAYHYSPAQMTLTRRDFITKKITIPDDAL
jgi:hypothetical protein